MNKIPNNVIESLFQHVLSNVCGLDFSNPENIPGNLLKIVNKKSIDETKTTSVDDIQKIPGSVIKKISHTTTRFLIQIFVRTDKKYEFKGKLYNVYYCINSDHFRHLLSVFSDVLGCNGKYMVRFGASKNEKNRLVENLDENGNSWVRSSSKHLYEEGEEFNIETLTMFSFKKEFTSIKDSAIIRIEDFEPLVDERLVQVPLTGAWKKRPMLDNDLPEDFEQPEDKLAHIEVLGYDEEEKKDEGEEVVSLKEEVKETSQNDIPEEENDASKKVAMKFVDIISETICDLESKGFFDEYVKNFGEDIESDKIKIVIDHRIREALKYVAIDHNYLNLCEKSNTFNESMNQYMDSLSCSSE